MPSLSAMVAVPFALSVFSFNRKGKTIVWRGVAKWILNVFFLKRGGGGGALGGVSPIYIVYLLARL